MAEENIKPLSTAHYVEPVRAACEATDMAEELNIKFIEGEFQRVVIAKDDILVLSYPGHLSPDAWGRIRARIHREFPKLKVLLLEEGMKAGVIAQENPVEPFVDLKAGPMHYSR